MHYEGSLLGLAAKPLAKEVGDIRLVVHDKILTVMMPPLPLSPGRCGAIER
jgi:hypothetical protein